MGVDTVYLEVPVTTPSETARQLGIPTSTLKRGLDGHHVVEQFYPPVLGASTFLNAYFATCG